MSLFSNPQEHAANPPESWVVIKKGNRSWSLQAGGAELQRYETKRAAGAAKTQGFYAKLYADEARWYAGENIPRWKSYAQCLAER